MEGADRHTPVALADKHQRDEGASFALMALAFAMGVLDQLVHVQPRLFALPLGDAFVDRLAQKPVEVISGFERAISVWLALSYLTGMLGPHHLQRYLPQHIVSNCRLGLLR